ncbi:MAG: c-type cytochrome [Phycisphaerales bacterium]
MPTKTALAPIAALLLITAAAARDTDHPRPISLPETEQRSGAVNPGRDYLLTGDANGSGMPRLLFDALGLARNATPRLERDGDNANLPHTMTAFTDAHGVDVVAMVNCLACHAQELNGELVIGLGNSLADWTAGVAIDTAALRAVGAFMTSPDTPERASYLDFIRGAEALAGRMHTPFRGVTPAFRIEELAASQRDPRTLAWTEEPVFEPLPRPLGSDVPPWWHVRKKNALYSTAIGRGDFATLLQQIGVVGLKDADQARRINERMPDLVAYLGSIEPPAYPHEIDLELARRGEAVFTDHCAKCHGTYDTFGAEETYPNKLVHVETVGTDSEYARSLVESPFAAWYNASVFAELGNGSSAEPTMAYVAPPLDGIWATAPYFHNGSVPKLEQVIDSTTRPTLWRRTFDASDYDTINPGWNYTEPDKAIDTNTYNTTIPGYGNEGHTFGDELSDDERRALIEYLKTL